MKKRIFLTLVTLAIGVITLSCVSPFYGTARIEKGFHADVGAAGITYIGEWIEYNAYHAGGRGDLEVSYGFNKYLQINGRIGLGGGKNLDPYPVASWSTLFLDGGIGIQGALPIGWFIPVLRAEISYPMQSLGLLMGFGKREVLTLGGRLYFLHFETGIYDAFVAVHPFPRWSVFAGINPSVDSDGRIIGTLGIGYKLK